jgi:hypothetical protein
VDLTHLSIAGRCARCAPRTTAEASTP